MKNILITSAGKRVTLVEIFKKALKSYGSEAMVYTTDMNPLLAPAGIVSDKCFKVPRVTNPDYISILLSICINHDVGMVIPTIDTELLILSENKKLFQEKDISLIVSDQNFIRLCRDKRNTGSFLQKMRIRIPAPIDKYHPTFPLFAKPYDGSLSKDLFVVKTADELTPDILHHPKLIFMEYIDKQEYKEFSVDMYYGKDHHVKSIIPRERLEIRAGEINKGYTRKNFLVDYLKERMEYLPGVVGCICIQLFYKKENSKRLLNYILCIRFFIEVHSIVSASRFFHMPTYLRVVIECQSRFFPFFPAFSRNCPDYFLHTSGSSSFRSLSDLGAR